MTEASLFPADIYQVVNKSLLSESDKLVLNMLYMPILGNLPVTLYLTLYNELQVGGYVSNELNHYHLMTSMSVSLENIKSARIKLEGIGLLKTFFKDGNVNSYVYELHSPVSSVEFFSHPIFNTVLYNYIGKDEYNRLVEYFKMPYINLKGYIEVTSPFDYTFKSMSVTPFELENSDIAGKSVLKLNYETLFDFDLLISMMPKNIFNERALNKAVRELITSLSFLYEIDPLSMSDLVKASLNDKGLIDRDILRKSARRFYQYEHDNRLPSLIFKRQPDYLKSPKGDYTGRGRILRVFEKYTPYEFLKAKNKGVRPTERDMKILEMLLVDLKLSPAVVNVLIDYILKTSNNRLNKSYVEAIAGQWKRVGIETATEAMEIAEKEHKKTSKVTTKKTESVPTWFNKEVSSTPISDEEVEEFNSFLEEFRK